MRAFYRAALVILGVLIAVAISLPTPQQKVEAKRINYISADDRTHVSIVRKPVPAVTTTTTTAPPTTTTVPRRTERASRSATVTTTAPLPVPDPGECGIPGPATKHPAAENNALGECLFHSESPWKGDAAQWKCLNHLWGEHESGWNDEILTPDIADGIPQAYPATKMGGAHGGADWRTNPATQIRWGFWYIDDRYETPCEAERMFHTRTPTWY